MRATADVLPQLTRAVDYWNGDGEAIRRGLAAFERLAILLEHVGLSEVASERAAIWLRDSRAALQRFQTPWGAA